MFRRQAVMEAGSYPREFAYCMDYLLYFRLARHHNLACLSEPLVAIRSHASQITSLPAWGLRKELEAVAAFQEILTYPDLPIAVRKGLLRYRALTSLRLAALHMRARAPMQVFVWTIRAFVQAPCTFFRLVWASAAKRARQS